ncbi:MAG: SPASM domain-containing protein [Candidatus Wallbacteria bacterium]|nr:SPASM domain-containing protein [Candidatus Wallbacteria bacterium]
MNRPEALKRLDIIQFGITDFCNLRCVMCVQSEVEFQQLKKYCFSLEQFRSVIDSMLDSGLHANALYFYNVGEIFLAPDFLSMLSYAFEQNTENRIFDWVFLNTNATLIDRESAESLLGILEMQAQKTRVVIDFSLDASSASVYGKIRRNGDFDLVQENVRNLVIRRTERGTSNLNFIFQIVIQPRNFHEVGSFVDYWSGFLEQLSLSHALLPMENLSYTTVLKEGCDIINLRPLSICHEKEFDRSTRKLWEFWVEKLIRGGSPALPEIPDDDWKIASLDRLQIAEGKDLAKVRKIIPWEHQRKNPCPFPFKSALILPSGEVTVCCFEPFSLGNLDQNTFSEIWFSKTASEKREASVRRDFARLSANCPTCPVAEDTFFDYLQLSEIDEIFSGKPEIIDLVLSDCGEKVLMKADFFLRKGRYGLALQLCRSLPEGIERGEFTHYAACLAQSDGFDSEALEFLLLAEQSDPDSVRVRLTEALINSGRYAEAEARLQRLEPGDQRGRLYYRLGRDYLRDNPAEAERCLITAEQEMDDPKEAKAHLRNIRISL